MTGPHIPRAGYFNRDGTRDSVARAIVLAEGALGRDDGKTAHGLVLHALRDEIVAVIDSRHTGRDAGEVIADRHRGIPVVADYDAAMALGDIQVLYLGAAPVGGRLPSTFRDVTERALRDGLTVYSGLHTFLSDDLALQAAARAGQGRIIDVRKPPEDLVVADGRIHDCRTPRILVMGTDSAVGKRVTTVELYRAARRRGLDAGFVATGQTGCMLGPDAGAVIDRVPSDFCAGQVERMITGVAETGRSPIFTYGQSSILHPAYSGVALSILHGARPHAVILQHAPARSQRALFAHPAYRVADLDEEIDLIQRLGDVKVVGISVNGKGCEDIERTCAALTDATGLPAVDPLKMDVTPLLDAALEHVARQQGAARPATPVRSGKAQTA